MSSKRRRSPDLFGALKLSVEELNLSVRASNCLGTQNFLTVADVVVKTSDELLSRRHVGRTSLKEIKIKLADLGLSPGMAPAFVRFCIEHEREPSEEDEWADEEHADVTDQSEPTKPTEPKTLTELGHAFSEWAEDWGGFTVLPSLAFRAGHQPQDPEWCFEQYDDLQDCLKDMVLRLEHAGQAPFAARIESANMKLLKVVEPFWDFMQELESRRPTWQQWMQHKLDYDKIQGRLVEATHDLTDVLVRIDRILREGGNKEEQATLGSSVRADLKAMARTPAETACMMNKPSQVSSGIRRPQALGVVRRIQEAERLIQRFPDRSVPTGGVFDRVGLAQVEAAKAWCEQVALWTEGVLVSAELGSHAAGQINWTIRALMPGQQVRKHYDKLVGLLIEGYELIRDRSVGSKAMMTSGVLDEGVEGQTPKLLTEHAKEAIGVIRNRLEDPAKNWTVLMFKDHMNSGVDPFVVNVLDLLGKCAVRWLSFNLNYCVAQEMIDGTEARRFMETIQVEAKTEWQEAYEQLESCLRSEAAHESVPWMWLGVNLLGYSIPQRSDVFEEVPANLQQIVGALVASEGMGPTPDFLSLVQDSLKAVTVSLKAEAETKPFYLRETAKYLDWLDKLLTDGTLKANELRGLRHILRQFRSWPEGLELESPEASDLEQRGVQLTLRIIRIYCPSYSEPRASEFFTKLWDDDADAWTNLEAATETETGTVPTAAATGGAGATKNLHPTRQGRGPTQKQRDIAKYYEETGKTQAECAQDLAKIYGVIRQETVSKAVKAVNRTRRWNGLPLIPTRKKGKKPAAMDPSRIELGKREDGRPVRQRLKRKEMDEERD